MAPLLQLELQNDEDVVLARRRVRQLAAALGFDAQAQTRIATAASELVRNAYRYAKGGRVECWLSEAHRGRVFHLRVRDDGPGIPHLASVLGGTYKSSTGLGLGLIAARRLADDFFIEAPEGAGTTVEIRKLVPHGAPTFGQREAARFADMVAHERRNDPFAEVQHQNQELLRVLAELRERSGEIERLNAALERRGAELLVQAAAADDARRLADQANRAKSDFLAMMSHELRTPLGAILGYARLIELGAAGPVSPEQRAYLARIAAAQEHLLGLIDNLLSFARLDSGRLPLDPERVLLGELCSATHTLTQPQIAASGVRYRCMEVPPDLAVFADRGKVLQILVNLVSNAIKFTEPGGEIGLAVEVVPDLVRVAVHDTGRGIPASQLEAIFEPFVQVERRLRGTGEGVGLGLAISRELARAMGGDVQVASTLGTGSVFTLTLPRGPAEAVSSTT
jgi:signal transduction histidine kinase